MLYCPNYKKVAWSHGITPDVFDRVTDAGNPDMADVGNLAGRAILTRLRCKQWSCDFCSVRNQSIWRKHLSVRLPAVSLRWWSITLTAHEKDRGQEETYNNLQTGIDRLFKRARRVWRKLQYVRVHEKHPASEALHTHLVVSDLSEFVKWTRQKNGKVRWQPANVRHSKKGYWLLEVWWKRCARECGMGYQVKVRECTSLQAMFYATKYLTKGSQDIRIKGLRHVSVSRKIGSPGFETDLVWETGQYIRLVDLQSGERLTDLQTGEIVPPDYWETAWYYPPDENTPPDRSS